MTDSFERWLASYLCQEESQVATLLNNRTATRFLIAWSIFESDCFDRFFQFKNLNDYSKKVVETSGCQRESFADALRHFHARYQEPRRYNNLMHEQKSPELKQILEKHVETLTPSEGIFLLVAVIYRYRNNIFHGNKGVSSWLQFRKQIDWCTKIMQELIDISSG